MTSLLGLFWPKSSLTAATVADQVARAVTRYVADCDAAPGELVATVHGSDPSIAARVRAPTFQQELAALLGVNPPRVHVTLAAGEPHVSVHADLGAPEAAWLEIDGRPHALGTRRHVYVGRGPTRSLLPQHPNDIQLAEAHEFVHRDAFVLAWNPGRGWELSVDAELREDVRVQRGSARIRLQSGSFLLRDGDGIVLTSTRQPKMALILPFHLGEA